MSDEEPTVNPGQPVMSETELRLELIRARREASKPRIPPGKYATNWLGEVIVAFAAWAWASFLKSPPVQFVWRNPLFQYVYSMIYVSLDVFIQKLGMFHLDEVDFVGGPAQDLTAIVTGPTSGIGTETAATLARRGAKVVLACRTLAKGEELKTQIEAQAVSIGRPKPDIRVMKLDLASLKSVREFAEQ